MYKNNQTRKSNKKLFLLIPLALVVIGGTLFALEKTGVIDLYKSGVSSNSTDQSPTGEIPSANPTNTVDYGPASPSDNNPIPDKDPNPPSTIPVNTELSATITSTRRSSDGSSYLVKVAVAGTDSGTCKLTMTKGTKVFTDTSDITIPANQYSCNNLEIPMSSLNETGEWTIDVVVTDSNGASTTTTAKVIL